MWRIRTVEDWWERIESLRILRGIRPAELAAQVRAREPSRTGSSTRHPSARETLHPNMRLSRSLVVMESLGARLCGWRSADEVITALELIPPTERRQRTTPRDPWIRTVLRQALARREVWLEVDGVDAASAREEFCGPSPRDQEPNSDRFAALEVEIAELRSMIKVLAEQLDALTPALLPPAVAAEESTRESEMTPESTEDVRSPERATPTSTDLRREWPENIAAEPAPGTAEDVDPEDDVVILRALSKTLDEWPMGDLGSDRADPPRKSPSGTSASSKGQKQKAARRAAKEARRQNRRLKR